MGKIFIISGPAGVGKTTLAKAIHERMPELCMNVSYTTRLPRQGERDGEDYYFVTSECFNEMKQSGHFLESVDFASHAYGTSKKLLEQALEQNQSRVLYVIEVEGAKKIKALYPESSTIFILPPSVEVLKERLSQRGSESLERQKQRLNRAIEEIEVQNWFDYRVINDDFAKALSEIEKILRKS